MRDMGVNAQLNAMTKRLDAGRIASIAGYVTAVGVPFADSIPARFKAGGPGWDFPLVRQGGAPMVDSERLSKSIAYQVRGRGVSVGTNVPYAAQLNGDYGSTFRIRAKNREWLTVPNPNALTPSQVRGAQAWDFPTAFKLIYGPMGPGIYIRRARGVLEKLFSLKKEVTIKARPFLETSASGMEVTLQAAEQYVQTGQLPFGIPIRDSGGNPDVGPRRGGRP